MYVYVHTTVCCIHKHTQILNRYILNSILTVYHCILEEDFSMLLRLAKLLCIYIIEKLNSISLVFKNVSFIFRYLVNEDLIWTKTQSDSIVFFQYSWLTGFQHHARSNTSYSHQFINLYQRASPYFCYFRFIRCFKTNSYIITLVSHLALVQNSKFIISILIAITSKLVVFFLM